MPHNEQRSGLSDAIETSERAEGQTGTAPGGDVPAKAASQRCNQAVMAALEVVNEECDSNLTTRIIDADTMVLVPKRLMDRINELDSPISPQQFEQVVTQSEFMADWLAGMVGPAVNTDNPEQVRAAIESWGERFLNQNIDGEPTDETVNAVMRQL